MLAQEGQAGLHQLVVVRFVAGGTAQLGNAGAPGKFDPDFGDKHAFKVKTNNFHRELLMASEMAIFEKRAFYQSVGPGL